MSAWWCTTLLRRSGRLWGPWPRVLSPRIGSDTATHEPVMLITVTVCGRSLRNSPRGHLEPVRRAKNTPANQAFHMEPPARIELGTYALRDSIWGCLGVSGCAPTCLLRAGRCVGVQGCALGLLPELMPAMAHSQVAGVSLSLDRGAEGATRRPYPVDALFADHSQRGAARSGGYWQKRGTLRAITDSL